MSTFHVVRDGFGIAGQNATFAVRPYRELHEGETLVAGPFATREEAVAERDRLHRQHCDGQCWVGWRYELCRHQAHAS